MGRRDQSSQRGVVDSADRRERRDPFHPQDLVLVDVADAGHRSLIQERDGDLQVLALRQAQASMRFRRIKGRGEQIRPQARQRRMEVFRALLEEFDDRSIEADRDRARHLQHQSRPRRRPSPALAGSIAVPRPVHAQVRPDLQAAVEPDEQVLAKRLHGVDATPDQPLDLGHRPWALGTCGRHVPPDEMRPQPGGRAEERVAFGHSDRGWEAGESIGHGGVPESNVPRDERHGWGIQGTETREVDCVAGPQAECLGDLASVVRHVVGYVDDRERRPENRELAQRRSMLSER